MGNTKGTTVSIAVVFLVLLVALAIMFLLSPPASLSGGNGGDGVGKSKEPELVERAIGISGSDNWLDAFRAWVKMACMRLRQPEARYDLRSPSSVKGVAKRSMEMGKETVKQAAESAARAAEETVEKTTEKMKRKVSSPR